MTTDWLATIFLGALLLMFISGFVTLRKGEPKIAQPPIQVLPNEPVFVHPFDWGWRIS